MKPIRIQRKRTKGWKMPPNTVYVGRPTKWGNPFRVGYSTYNTFLYGGHIVKDNKHAVYCFKKWLVGILKREAKKELKGKNLCCWCSLDQPCHADVLLKIANS